MNSCTQCGDTFYPHDTPTGDVLDMICPWCRLELMPNCGIEPVIPDYEELGAGDA